MTDKHKTTEGYIFDYGGTLDTGGCHWGRRIWHAYERAGVPVGEELFREAYVYAERELARNPIIQPDYTFRKTLAVKLRIEMEYISDRQPGFDAMRWQGAVLDILYGQTKEETAKSKAVLVKLKERYPMALVSNFYGNISTVLGEFGLDGLFDSIVESAVVGVRKPDHRIFTLGVEALGMEPGKVTVVGDSYDKDIVPAKRAGCRTVWMRGEGWTDTTESDTSAADAVITELKEIL
ncbi:HAD family hydrolase [Prevotella sp. MGM1]|uniref:HAD family hydrolase n=1 Tax=Prevotella sp. MGM1 TaxID=2033405 RepID=UPI000CEA4DE2|nr:HAD family hydrolase [Prevotella sp. MGM1]GAY27968.1 HAD family hydrolase [Prevotella sp. MGM1]